MEKSVSLKKTKLLRPDQVAQRLNVSRGKIYRLLAKKCFIGLKIGCSTRIVEDSLEKYIVMTKKKCSKCGEIGGKDGCGFNKHNNSKDGYYYSCKACCNEWSYKHRQKNIKKFRKKEAKYRQNNRGRIEKYRAEYTQKNRGKIKKYKIKYRKCLSDSYVKLLLVSQFDVNRSEITPEMIKLKRESLTFKRLERRLKNGINSARD